MKNKLNIYTITILPLVLLALIFYWYSWRPGSIVSHCSLSAISDRWETEGDREDYEYLFTLCIREKGLVETDGRIWRISY